MSRSLRDEHKDKTRKALLRSARSLFARQGYADTAVEEVAKRARVTQGALYHHFGGKKELFRAVFEEMERELVETVAAASAPEPDPWARVEAALGAFFDACEDPALQRIAFLDAPGVLGWEVVREIETRYALGATSAMLDQLVRAGLIRPLDKDVLAHLFLSALTEAAMMISRAPSPVKARQEAELTVRALLRGLAAD